MSPDPTSLDRLHDIVVPPPVPWWPPAPGWLWLLGIAVLLAGMLLFLGLRRWQRARYRREALAILEQLRAAGAAEPQILLELAELLKRVALTAYPREQVAALTGHEWFAFLDRTGGTHFCDGLGSALERSVYRVAAEVWDADRRAELADEIGRWIRGHAMVPEVDDGAPASARAGQRSP